VVRSFLDAPSQNLPEFLIYHRNPQLKPSRLGPFLSNLGKRGGGVCGHVQKSEAQALGCRPLGESSQWSSNSLQTSRIVPAWNSQWNSERKEAKWSCASQLWVPGDSATSGESCGHGRPYLSFCPLTLRHCSFRSWWVCRWMQISKKNTEWYPFCLGGSTGRGVWGVSGPSGVSTPKSIRAIQKIKNTLLT